MKSTLRKIKRPITEGRQCYHYPDHGNNREAVANWCMGCLVLLIKEKQILSLSEIPTTDNQPTPMEALKHLRRNIEEAKGKKFTDIDKFLKEVYRLWKAPTKFRKDRRLSFSKNRANGIRKRAVDSNRLSRSTNQKTGCP